MLPVPGGGANFVSSVHVDDGTTAAVAALDAPAGVYNVTDDEPLRMRDYAQVITDAFGLKPPRWVPRWLFRLIGGGPAKYILSSQRVSNARFKQTTGWGAEVSERTRGLGADSGGIGSASPVAEMWYTARPTSASGRAGRSHIDLE